MHELSIAAAILDSVAAQAARHPGARVIRVGVRVGEISGVDADALSFGFEALTRDSEWAGLALHIESCPRVQRCSVCSHEFAAPDSETICPACGALATVCLGGDELDISFIELEER